MEIDFKNVLPIRPGSPFRSADARFKGDWTPHLQGETWQDLHAYGPDERFYLLVSWRLKNGKPGFAFTLVDTVEKTVHQSPRIPGCCESITWKDGRFRCRVHSPESSELSVSPVEAGGMTIETRPNRQRGKLVWRSHFHGLRQHKNGLEFGPSTVLTVSRICAGLLFLLLTGLGLFHFLGFHHGWFWPWVALPLLVFLFLRRFDRRMLRKGPILHACRDPVAIYFPRRDRFFTREDIIRFEIRRTVFRDRDETYPGSQLVLVTRSGGKDSFGTQGERARKLFSGERRLVITGVPRGRESRLRRLGQKMSHHTGFPLAFNSVKPPRACADKISRAGT